MFRKETREVTKKKTIIVLHEKLYTALLIVACFSIPIIFGSLAFPIPFWLEILGYLFFLLGLLVMFFCEPDRSKSSAISECSKTSSS